MTVRGTIHVSQSDFSILYPNVCSFALKMTADPKRALDVNVNSSLEFLKIVMPGIPDRILDAFPNEGLLCGEEEPLENIPTGELHRPRDEQWTGGRLSIPHEFWWRIMPAAARKAARARSQKKGIDSGSEVWIHRRPDEAVVEKYSANARAGSMGKKGGNPSSHVAPQSVPCNDKTCNGKRGHLYCKGQKA